MLKLEFVLENETPPKKKTLGFYGTNRSPNPSQKARCIQC